MGLAKPQLIYESAVQGFFSSLAQKVSSECQRGVSEGFTLVAKLTKTTTLITIIAAASATSTLNNLAGKQAVINARHGWNVFAPT